MADFELSPEGLQTPRFPEARSLVVAKWKEKFGSGAQTGSDSPDGLIIDTLATVLALAWEGVSDAYAAGFFRTSTDSAVDAILDLFGRRRILATSSTASCVWYGDAGVIVSSANSRPVASATDTGDRFAATEDGTTVASGAGGPVVVRVLEAVDGDTYAIDVDTTSESTVIASGGSTTASIADALATELETDNPSATVSRGGEDADGAALIVLEGIGAGVVTVGGSASEASNADVRFGVRLAMTAEETGPRVALAGNLNTSETPITNIDGVCSTADASTGRNRETDSEMKARHLAEINTGSATPESIRARLLELKDENEAQLLDFVRVFENESWVTDADGRPPKSFEVVWIGPAGSATEQTVADTIWAHKPLGIQAYGSISTDVEDSLGDTHAIGHSRGTEEYLHLDVTIVPGEGYPTTGDPEGEIEAAIVAFLSDGGAGELGLGTDFYRFSLGIPIGTTVPGVGSVTITADATAAPGDTPTLTASDITVDADTILRVDSSRISVHT